MPFQLSDVEYARIARRFQLMKYIHGPEWVQATLRRHRDIYFALCDYEKRYIIDLESNLILRSSTDESNHGSR